MYRTVKTGVMKFKEHDPRQKCWKNQEKIIKPISMVMFSPLMKIVICHLVSRSHKQQKKTKSFSE